MTTIVRVGYFLPHIASHDILFFIYKNKNNQINIITSHHHNKMIGNKQFKNIKDFLHALQLVFNEIDFTKLMQVNCKDEPIKQFGFDIPFEKIEPYQSQTTSGNLNENCAIFEVNKPFFF